MRGTKYESDLFIELILGSRIGSGGNFYGYFWQPIIVRLGIGQASMVIYHYHILHQTYKIPTTTKKLTQNQTNEEA